MGFIFKKTNQQKLLINQTITQQKDNLVINKVMFRTKNISCQRRVHSLVCGERWLIKRCYVFEACRTQRMLDNQHPKCPESGCTERWASGGVGGASAPCHRAWVSREEAAAWCPERRKADWDFGSCDGGRERSTKRGSVKEPWICVPEGSRTLFGKTLQRVCGVNGRQGKVLEGRSQCGGGDWNQKKYLGGRGRP